MSDSNSMRDLEERIMEHFRKNCNRKLLKSSKERFMFYLRQYDEIVKTIPKHILEGTDDESEVDAEEGNQPEIMQEKTQRVQKIEQLQKKLKTLRGKSLTKAQFLERKGLKNRLKKKIKKEERMKMKNQGSFDKKMEKANKQVNIKEKKQDKNEDDNVIFSKFDFSDDSDKKKKGPRDPFRILQKVEKSNKKLREMENKGRVEKVKQIRGKMAWDVAIKKAEGEKVKDDVELLKKSIKKIKNSKNRSKKKWEERESIKKQKLEEAQKKRHTNIVKKKTEKKKKKVKKLIKKGRIAM